MRRNKRNSSSSDSESFYISWGDLVSLLLVFFVYLFSISEFDVVKFLEVTSSMKEEIIQVKDDVLKKLQIQQEQMTEMKNQIDAYIKQERLESVLDAQVFDDRMELRMGNVLLFDAGSSHLKVRAEEV